MRTLPAHLLAPLARELGRKREEVAALLETAGDDPARFLALAKERGWLADGAAPRVRALLAGIPLWDPETEPPDEEVLRMLPVAELRRYRALPVRLTEAEVLVALENPLDLSTLEKLEKRLGRPVRPLLLPAGLLEERLQALAVQEKEAGTPEPLPAFSIDVDRLRRLARKGDQVPFEGDYAVMQLVELILATGIQKQASDIHIDPDADALRVRMRVDGLLEDLMELPRELSAAVAARVKVLADLDLAEKRLPQDGHFAYHTPAGDKVDIRVATCPIVHGEKVVLRLLRGAGPVARLHAMGFPRRVTRLLGGLARAPHGLVVVAGPTGSGKTTTLYALLREVNAVTENILTVEDPVEYRLPRLNQVQVNVRAGRTFARVLRSFLRQDPDVILVGETRDRETAALGHQAALTGHLVLTTLHANTVTQVPARLADLGVPNHLIATALLAALGQRLVRRLCPDCKAPAEPEPEFLAALGVEALPPGSQLCRPRGCPRCRGTGFDGRLPLVEVMPVSETVRTLIHEGAPPSRIRAALDQAGHVRMRVDGIRRVLRGETTLAEVLRVTGDG